MQSQTSRRAPVGRFAPSPSGRMHLGNIFTAVLSWLSVRSRGGRWVLRIEDLDPQRSRPEYARLIEDDLEWLGLHHDEGGIDGTGPGAPYMQSMRSGIYEQYFDRLLDTGYAYQCSCTRADLLAVNAPHQTDGRLIYPGTCRPADLPCDCQREAGKAVRLFVPDEKIRVDDDVFGHTDVNLARECGDFVIRRADGAWSYQLAVVVDDAMMGVTEVMRGCDLLLSAAQQIYLRRLLGLPRLSYAHLPLICNTEGRRLSKRDSSLSMEALRQTMTPGSLLGLVGYLAGLLPQPTPITAEELIPLYSIDKIPRKEKIIVSL